jgi:hypothetical protein
MIRYIKRLRGIAPPFPKPDPIHGHEHGHGRFKRVDLTMPDGSTLSVMTIRVRGRVIAIGFSQ